MAYDAKAVHEQGRAVPAATPPTGVVVKNSSVLAAVAHIVKEERATVAAQLGELRAAIEAGDTTVLARIEQLEKQLQESPAAKTDALFRSATVRQLEDAIASVDQLHTNFMHKRSTVHDGTPPVLLRGLF